ncbi:TrmB family transcriptional regulator [Haloglomus halophilum]|uniref:TrmB family transcriptional regulator n=1 Tax=Haloglomus halophilum TaxID=2962672 RepID=UPI0020CA1D6C|nr:helix-turn-helix domain-containing protein [Haloglomus halophilum]
MSSANNSEPLDAARLSEYLQEVMGWGKYEAAAYITLVRMGTLEASEIVARTAVPQGRVYDVLEGLEGEAVRVQGRQPKRYQALHPRQVITDRKERFTTRADTLTDQLEQDYEIERERSSDRYPAWVHAGINGTLKDLRERMDAAEERIWLVEETGQWIDDTDVRELNCYATHGIDVQIVGTTGWEQTLATIAETAATAYQASDVDLSYALVDATVILRVGRGDTGVTIADDGMTALLERDVTRRVAAATRLEGDGTA